MRCISVPNLITFLRLLLLIPLVVFLISGDLPILVAIFFLFVLLDILDGWLARRLDQVTQFGDNFDFIADNLFLATVFATQVILGRVPLLVWLAALAGAALVAVGLLRGWKGVHQKWGFSRFSGCVAYGFVFLLMVDEYNIVTGIFLSALIVIILCLGVYYNLAVTPKRSKHS